MIIPEPPAIESQRAPLTPLPHLSLTSLALTSPRHTQVSTA